jgi:hypothetical protein
VIRFCLIKKKRHFGDKGKAKLYQETVIKIKTGIEAGSKGLKNRRLRG